MTDDVCHMRTKSDQPAVLKDHNIVQKGHELRRKLMDLEVSHTAATTSNELWA